MPVAILFDLDGTLVDSIELIINSARHAFTGYDGRVPSDDEWRSGIGIPLATMFRHYARDEDEVQGLIGRYREYQMEHHDRLVRAYEDVVPTVRRLDAAGHRMALVTSKADWLAKRALVHVGLEREIPVIVGCDSCVRHKPHPEPVERALALLHATARDAIFVGDSPHDVEAGRAAGVHTVGVTWGAFSAADMAACGADDLIDRITELRDAIARFEARRN